MFSWFKRRNGSKSRGRYVIVYARVSEGVSAELGFRLRDLHNRVDPEGWWFINPGSFLSMFLVANAGRERAATLVREIEALKSTDPELTEISFGQAEGELTNIETRPDGKILSIPRGSLLNEAARAALR